MRNEVAALTVSGAVGKGFLNLFEETGPVAAALFAEFVVLPGSLRGGLEPLCGGAEAFLLCLIEHHLFSHISSNWAGKPLRSYETVVKYAQTTKTSCGLRVSARLVRKNYNKGEEISHTEMGKLMLASHKTLPAWNYTLAPSKM